MYGPPKNFNLKNKRKKKKVKKKRKKFKEKAVNDNCDTRPTFLGAISLLVRKHNFLEENYHLLKENTLSTSKIHPFCYFGKTFGAEIQDFVPSSPPTSKQIPGQ